jgi:hypothetical protein
MRHAIQQWPVRIASALDALNTVLSELDKQVATLEREIAEVLASGSWAASATVLLNTPGFGLVTTVWLLVQQFAEPLSD